MKTSLNFKPLTIQFAKLNRILSVVVREKQTALILPPTDFGSLGDQAMVNAVIENLRKQNYKKITLIAYSSVEQCKSFYQHEDVVQFIGFKKFIQEAKFYQDFYCLGADVMDGYYSEKRSLLRFKLASIASKTGLNSSILGFSFNELPKPSTVSAIKELPESVQLYSRDPISYQRLSKAGPKSLELVADLAFLLKPDGSSVISQSAAKWIRKQHDKSRFVIGLNINCKIAEICKEKSNEELIKTFKNVLIYLYQNHSASFILIPHDFRSKEGILSDIEFCERISCSLPEEIQSHTYHLSDKCTAKDVKFICGQVDFILTGRMHLAIAALGQETPPACITYQGKFEGLFQHFSLEGMTLDPEEGLTSEKLIEFLVPLIEMREEIKQLISKMLPQVEQLSAKNLKE